MAHPGGRPRYIEPKSKEECEKLGEELLLWATEPTEEKRTSLGFWYSLEKGILRQDWKALIKREEFRPYYESAQLALARKLHNDELEKGMAQRYLRLFDRDLVEEENEQAKYDADLKKSEESTPQKVVFEVNYKNDHHSPIDVSSSFLSTSDTPSSE